MKAVGFAVLLGVALLPGVVHASSAENVRVEQAWLRILPGNLPAAGYAVLQNTGDQPAALTGARSSLYANVMLHFSSVAGGTSRMHMAEAMPIPVHGSAQLAPGGYHLMLSDPAHPMIPGDHVVLTLTFADGSTLATTFIARPANAVDAGPTSPLPPVPGATAPLPPNTHGSAHKHP
ncbi:MAG TPA: copper chaperone PCu(A)C [Rhodanobacter sp.]|nr:copper chaperone PCu(A)C [Rhodanobacter sp.]